MKSSDFYCKRHILAWKHVVWAILRECPLRDLTPRAEREKSQKVSDSHRNDVSPLTQGLRYRAACDTSGSATIYSDVDITFSEAAGRLRHTCEVGWTTNVRERQNVSSELSTGADWYSNLRSTENIEQERQLSQTDRASTGAVNVGSYRRSQLIER